MLTSQPSFLPRRLYRLLPLAAILTFLSACAPTTSLHSDVPLPPHPFLHSEILTPTPSPTASPSATAKAPDPPTASATPTPTATPTPAYPEEHFIRTIRGHRQYFSLSCEAAVATDWAAYFGVTLSEYNFQFELPLSDNPEKGFVGDVNAPWGQVPPYGYGVHAPPVAELLRKYGLPAQAVKGWSINQLKEELSHDQPVIVWVIGNVEGGVPAEYTDQEGDRVTVAAYEHTIILTGYNTSHLRYMTNGKFFDVPISVFENSWSILGNMAIYYAD